MGTMGRLAAAVLTAGAALAPAAPARAEAVALVGATVIDGTGAPPVREAAVVVGADGRITRIGPARTTPIPPGVPRMDLFGKWIIPGLIDAHVHFFQSGGLYTRPDIIDLRRVRPYAEERARVRARIGATLARYLASGVTTVVDVGGPMWNFTVRALARGRALAPRVAVAGPLLATYAPPALSGPDPPIVRIASPAAARAEIRRQLARRPDLVKIWFVFPRQSLEPEMRWVRAAIAEAHAAGVPVAVHATQARVARAVVEAGADILAHGIDDRPVDAALLRLLKARGVIYVPTLMVRPRYRRVLSRRLVLNGIERRLADPDALASLARRLARPRPAGPAPPVFDPMAGANLRRVRDAGVTLAAGSDAGNIGTFHGPALHRELELMAAAGLTPMEVIVAATAGGARVAGRSRDVGTLTPGRLADLVVLDADPLADIRNTRRIYRVVKGGRVFDPAAIVETLERAVR